VNAAHDALADATVAASSTAATTVTTEEVRSISHWSPYDRVGVVNADP
jgi:hypothetical protein